MRGLRDLMKLFRIQIGYDTHTACLIIINFNYDFRAIKDPIKSARNAMQHY